MIMTHKLTNMQHIAKAGLFLALATLIISCGNAGKDKDAALTEKKAQLEKLKKEQKKVDADIAKLEEEIAAIDPSAAREEKAKLVSLTTLAPGAFTHYIDLQGIIDAQNIAYATAANGGGQVKAVFVKQGQSVRKGQLLLKLDDAIVKKQIDQLQTQLAYAKDLYQRQQNLWNQNIGTEVQLINAKNGVDQLEKQIALAKEQLNLTNVYAGIGGVADQVTIRTGEFFTGNPQTGGYIRIVNTNDLKVKVQVPENYLERVGVGSTLEVTLPEANDKSITTKVSIAGKIIDPTSRSFYAEAPIPHGADFRPNQIALVHIRDYSASGVITIPVNTIQNDEKGKYVLVAAREGERMIARKRTVEIGELYGSELEIKSGLQEGDQLITEGFQGLYEGQLITTSAG